LDLNSGNPASHVQWNYLGASFIKGLYRPISLQDVTMTLSTKHRKTYQRLFKKPIPANILWHDIEALFIALGATLKEGQGSRIRVFLNGSVAVFHRPHPKKETVKGAVKSVRTFLNNAGVEVDDV